MIRRSLIAEDRAVISILFGILVSCDSPEEGNIDETNGAYEASICCYSVGSIIHCMAVRLQHYRACVIKKDSVHMCKCRAGNVLEMCFPW